MVEVVVRGAGGSLVIVILIIIIMIIIIVIVIWSFFFNPMNIGTKIRDHVSSLVFAIRNLRVRFVTLLWQVYSISQHAFA